MDRNVIFDSGLSPEALGLLLFALSHTPNFKLRKHYIMAYLGRHKPKKTVGKDIYKRVMSELRQARLLRDKVTNKGKFDTYFCFYGSVQLYDMDAVSDIDKTFRDTFANFYRFRFHSVYKFTAPSQYNALDKIYDIVCGKDYKLSNGFGKGVEALEFLLAAAAVQINKNDKNPAKKFEPVLLHYNINQLIVTAKSKEIDCRKWVKRFRAYKERHNLE